MDFGFAVETISPTQLIKDSESITSLAQTYRLGFFSPGNSSYRFVGIWCNILPGKRVVVWVANRENPVKDSLEVMKIHSDGNMVILNGKQNVMWTTNVSVAGNSSVVELLDSGNLVLREVSSNGSRVSNKGRILWQSFKHPTDTLLQDMKLVTNIKTGERQVITSWKTNSDPSKGRFVIGLEPLNIPQPILWNGSQRHWRSGPWDGRVFIGMEGMISNLKNGFNLVRDDPAGNVYVYFSYNVDFLSVSVNVAGELEQLVSVGGSNEKPILFAVPETDCQYLGKCGTFGFCNILSSPDCSCLKGYVPKSTEEWSKGYWSSGCIRRTRFQCEGNINRGGKAKGDGFLKYKRMKVPDFVDWFGKV